MNEVNINLVPPDGKLDTIITMIARARMQVCNKGIVKISLEGRLDLFRKIYKDFFQNRNICLKNKNISKKATKFTVVKQCVW